MSAIRMPFAARAAPLAPGSHPAVALHACPAGGAAERCAGAEAAVQQHGGSAAVCQHHHCEGQQQHSGRDLLRPGQGGGREWQHGRACLHAQCNAHAAGCSPQLHSKLSCSRFCCCFSWLSYGLAAQRAEGHSHRLCITMTVAGRQW